MDFESVSRFFFEHKNTKTHLSRPKKGTFSCFDVQGSLGWLAHQKKTEFLKIIAPARKGVTEKKV
jgi:hypothetical protein